jgi:nucleoside-diphosphate-sugar epimerase
VDHDPLCASNGFGPRAGPERSARGYGDLSAHRVAILGAGGCVGRRMIATLLDAGASVVAVRRAHSQPIPGCQPLHVDLQTEAAGDQIGRLGATVVISAAPIMSVVRSLARLKGTACPRLIVCSSMSVRSKLDSPSRGDQRMAAAVEAAELALLRSVPDAIVLRPTMVYGHPSTRNVASLQRFARSRRFLAVPSGATGLRQPVHCDDLADALLACASRGAVGRVYEFGGGERVSCVELARRVAASEGARLLSIPSPGLALVGRRLCAFGADRVGGVLFRSCQDQCADNGSASQDLGVFPRAFNPLPLEA